MSPIVDNIFQPARLSGFSSNSKFTLMGVAAEIRIPMFRILFKAPDTQFSDVSHENKIRLWASPIDRTECRTRLCCSYTLSSQILRVCKALLNNGLPIIYGINTFPLGYHFSLDEAYAAVCSVFLNRIQSLSIRGTQSKPDSLRHLKSLKTLAVVLSARLCPRMWI